MILVLFLISVGVMELILRRDRKTTKDPASRDRESATGTAFPLRTTVETVGTAPASPVTNDLLALIGAIESESHGVKPQLPATAIESSPLQCDVDRRELAQTKREYNREDGGAK